MSADWRLDGSPSSLSERWRRLPSERRCSSTASHLPSDAAVTASAGSAVSERFSGAWVGSWGDTLRHILVVERVSDQGEASVIYAVGDLAAAGIVRSWKRYKATVTGDALTISAGEPIAWSKRRVEFLTTDLVEDGRPVRLEVVLFKPEGEGPFPLIVFNHGSTGRGTSPERFTRTSWNFGLAEFFLDQGWMIAFPQRRGRGRSDGLYDEGFAPLRANGYSRAILMGGNSRGGILSVAYAGAHPRQVLGVVNFVGGWVGEGCGNADQINQTLFRRGASYDRPTLWLYGKDDMYYSIAHSRSNFEAYRKAGGKGDFVELDAGVLDGHDVVANPSLWKPKITEYLQDVRR